MDFGEEADERTQRHTAAAIAAARSRLDGDGAGDCTDCGAVIPEARRAAMPNATRCVDCQELLERREGR